MTMIPQTTTARAAGRKRPAAPELPDREAAGEGAWAEPGAVESLGFQLGSVLSSDAEDFVLRNRQPYGE